MAQNCVEKRRHLSVKPMKPPSFFVSMFFSAMHEHTHKLRVFPSSLRKAFPGPQHAQEIGSVIVYVCGENATTVFLAVVSWPISHSSATRTAEQRLSVSSSSLRFNNTDWSQPWLAAAGAHSDWIDPERLKRLVKTKIIFCQILNKKASVISLDLWSRKPLSHVLLLDSLTHKKTRPDSFQRCQNTLTQHRHRKGCTTYLCSVSCRASGTNYKLNLGFLAQILI